MLQQSGNQEIYMETQVTFVRTTFINYFLNPFEPSYKAGIICDARG